MTADIVARLREGAEYNQDWREDCLEAAAEIERLRAERDRLRAALEAIIERGDTDDSAKAMYTIARSALESAPLGEKRG